MARVVITCIMGKKAAERREIHRYTLTRFIKICGRYIQYRIACLVRCASNSPAVIVRSSFFITSNAIGNEQQNHHYHFGNGCERCKCFPIFFFIFDHILEIAPIHRKRTKPGHLLIFACKSCMNTECPLSIYDFGLQDIMAVSTTVLSFTYMRSKQSFKCRPIHMHMRSNYVTNKRKSCMRACMCMRLFCGFVHAPHIACIAHRIRRMAFGVSGCDCCRVHKRIVVVVVVVVVVTLPNTILLSYCHYKLFGIKELGVCIVVGFHNPSKWKDGILNYH